jgi:hypothetical protein
MAYSSKRSQKPKNSIGRKKNSEEFSDFFFALPSSFLLAETFWNSDQVTTRIGSTMMENKSRKTKKFIAVVIVGLVVAVVMAESVVLVVIAKSVVAVVIAKLVVAVVIAKSVVAVVMAVTRTRNSKGLDLKPALDTTMQTRVQQSKY